MTYAIISMGGKQYRVREGERLLVDRLSSEAGETLTPPVLLIGGESGAQLSPPEGAVTARVVEHRRGPKIVIGKHRQRTGYRRRTGFRAALTQIEIASIASGKAEAGSRPAKKRESTKEREPSTTASALPEGYETMTVAAIKNAVASWDADAVGAALEHERGHGQRKGALQALESALEKGRG